MPQMLSTPNALSSNYNSNNRSLNRRQTLNPHSSNASQKRMRRATTFMMTQPRPNSSSQSDHNDLNEHSEEQNGHLGVKKNFDSGDKNSTSGSFMRRATQSWQNNNNN